MDVKLMDEIVDGRRTTVHYKETEHAETLEYREWSGPNATTSSMVVHENYAPHDMREFVGFRPDAAAEILDVLLTQWRPA